MIKTNELRRDNIVGASARQKNGEKFPGLSGFFRIDEIRGRSITATYLENGLIFSLFEDEAEGIPLTPELLEKLGFEKSQFYVERVGTAFVWKRGKIRFLLDLENIFFHSGTDAKLPFLHQLQNLYFALTGEELDIKPLLK